MLNLLSIRHIAETIVSKNKPFIMANNNFVTSCYAFSPQENSNLIPLNGAMGLSNGFPSAGVRFYQAPLGQSVSGVVINSIIELLPTGLNKQPMKFYVTDSVATLHTAAT